MGDSGSAIFVGATGEKHCVLQAFFEIASAKKSSEERTFQPAYKVSN